jgi:hypothetical protein
MQQTQKKTAAPLQAGKEHTATSQEKMFESSTSPTETPSGGFRASSEGK